MTAPRNRRFTSAHVMAALALFISLGGTSYAVATLPKNSVGSAQVKNGSLTANDLAKGVVTAGPQGSSGARGPRGAEGAAGPLGPVGPVGPAGAGQPVPLVATLPVSPTDGQDVYFQSASMASSGVVWHLRYRSNATGPYKWEFVGGAGLHAVAGAATTTATTYLAGPVGPAITVPLAGEYDADLTARLYSSSNSAPAAALAVLGDGSGEFPNARIDHYQGSPATLGVTLVAATNTRLARITRGTPGVVDVRLFGNTGEVHSDFRELRIRPVRVG